MRRDKMLARAGKPARRWPKALGGLAFIVATVGAIVAVVVRRGRSAAQTGASDTGSADAAVTDEAHSAPAEAEAGFDGQVRTP